MKSFKIIFACSLVLILLLGTTNIKSEIADACPTYFSCDDPELAYHMSCAYQLINPGCHQNAWNWFRINCDPQIGYPCES